LLIVNIYITTYDKIELEGTAHGRFFYIFKITNRKAIMFIKFKRWYKGKKIESRDLDPLVFVSSYYKRHWTAELLRSCIVFIRREYKWLTGISLVIIDLVIIATR